MPIFNDTFRPHIIRELNHRKSHWHRQEVTIPNVRVTALVRTGGGYVGGNIRLGQIHGFTLGVPDVSQVNTVNQLHNLDEQGSIIGITYLGRDKNEPTPVRIPTKKNLPAPGITGVTISTQSKGGLTFKATVNFKMYGKEQYDAIYQLLFRPGNPVVIEYGHTRTEETLKDLNFFEELDDENLGRFKKDITQQSRFPSTRTTGTVCGLVSNFKVRLNKNNEYEASMDIINALEVMYSLPTENTLVHYTDPAKAASIKANFGYIENKEYDQAFDRVYQYILYLQGIADVEGNSTGQAGNENFIDLTSVNVTTLPAGHPSASAATDETQPAGFLDIPLASAAAFGTSPVGVGTALALATAETLSELEIIDSKVPESEDCYITLDYFLNNILDAIVYQTIFPTNDGCLTSVIRTPAEIRDAAKPVVYNREIGGPQSGRREIIEGVEYGNNEYIQQQNKSDYLTWAINASAENNVVVEFEKFKYYNTLRSTNLRNVLINNSSIYPDLTCPTCHNDSNSLGIVTKEIFKNSFNAVISKNGLENYQDNNIWNALFKNSSIIKTKAQYKEGEEWRGIFVNYNLIRESFIFTESIPEAITKILNTINASTAGIMNLKLKYTTRDANATDIHGKEYFYEQYVLTIYDEKNPPNPKDYEDVYTFFENDTSEAISYNFDFSLPQAVSSTVLANNFARNNPDVVGEAETYQLIYNGYEDHIQPLVDDFVKRPSDNCSQQNARLFKSDIVAASGHTNFWSWLKDATIGAAVENYYYYIHGIRPEDIDSFKKIQNLTKQETFENILGYKELYPSTMKSTAIRSGLLSTFPSSAKVSIKLLGIDGFRFGDLFRVKNMLPHPYDEYNIFMLTGYKHTIDDKGWFTDIDGIMIAGTPPEKDPKNLPEVERGFPTVTLGDDVPALPAGIEVDADNFESLQDYFNERNRNYVEREIVPDQVYTDRGTNVRAGYTDTFSGGGFPINGSGNNQP